MNCLIIDDEDLARALLKNYVDKIEGLHLIASCSSPMQAYPYLKEHQIDLLFLDIQMPEMQGITFFKSLTQKPLVVFTTAYSEYAIESYEIEAVDYLLKPIRFARFFQAVQKVEKRIQKPTANPTPSDCLTIKSGYDLHKVKLEDIRYIEGMKEYVAFHTQDKRIITLKTLKSLEKELPEDRFMRIHRSYIVQKQYVEALVNRQLVIGKAKIPVGESYLELVKAALF